jgi:hypothetical protein
MKTYAERRAVEEDKENEEVEKKEIDETENGK